MFKKFLSLCLAATLAVSIPQVTAHAEEASRITSDSMYGYQINVSVPADESVTTRFVCDDNWYTKGCISGMNLSGITGDIHKEGNSGQQIILTTDKDREWQALEKGSAYILELENNGQYPASVNVMFDKDELSKGGMSIYMGEGQEYRTYSVTGDDFDSDEAGYDQMIFDGLVSEISYSIDLSGTENDYEVVAYNVTEGKTSKTTSIPWTGNVSGKTNYYECLVTADAGWEGYEKGSQINWEHGNIYTYTVRYSYPEGRDFNAIYAKLSDDEKKTLAPSFSFRLALKKETTEDIREDVQEEDPPETKTEKITEISEKAISKTETTSVKTTKNGSSITYSVNGDTAFVTGANGKKIVIPDTIQVNGRAIPVTALEAEAFRNNSQVSEIRIGDNVRAIPDRCFENNTTLKKVYLGANVKSVGKDAFKKCKRLKYMNTKRSVKIGKGSFKGTSKKMTLTSDNLSKKKLDKIAKKMISDGKAKKVKVKYK